MKTCTVKYGLWAVVFTLFAFSASAVDDTYQVNMSIQRTLGNFNPANGDTVMLGGTYNGWSTNYVTLAVSADTNIYVCTVSNVVGAYEEHKFIINPGGNSIGNSLKWESIGNRYFTVPATPTNLPVVFFNDATNPVAVSAITFQVNMSAQIAAGSFDPGAGDLVYAVGDWDWTAPTSGPLLTQSASDTNIWTGTATFTNSISATMNYKFLYVPFSSGGTVWEGNVGPAGGQNRQFSFPGADTNLPVVWFNNVTNTSTSYPVTFTVNLAVPDAFGTNFTPGLDTVYVAGDWNSNPDAKLLTQTANPDVYTGTVAMVFAPGTYVNYKYNLNAGITWEGNVGPNNSLNRQFVMTNVPNVLPMDYFNNLTNLGPLSVSNNAGTVALTWAAGARIHLQSSTNLAGGWQDVPNTQGSNSLSTNVIGQQFFRLTGP